MSDDELHAAAAAGELSHVLDLLDNGPPFQKNAPDSAGRSAIFYAQLLSHVDIVKLLSKRGWTKMPEGNRARAPGDRSMWKTSGPWITAPMALSSGLFFCAAAPRVNRTASRLTLDDVGPAASHHCFGRKVHGGTRTARKVTRPSLNTYDLAEAFLPCCRGDEAKLVDVQRHFLFSRCHASMDDADDGMRDCCCGCVDTNMHKAAMAPLDLTSPAAVQAAAAEAAAAEAARVRLTAGWTRVFDSLSVRETTERKVTPPLAMVKAVETHYIVDRKPTRAADGSWAVVPPDADVPEVAAFYAAPSVAAPVLPGAPSGDVTWPLLPVPARRSTQLPASPVSTTTESAGWEMLSELDDEIASVVDSVADSVADSVVDSMISVGELSDSSAVTASAATATAWHGGPSATRVAVGFSRGAPQIFRAKAQLPSLAEANAEADAGTGGATHQAPQVLGTRRQASGIVFS
jgi:hypothetical protein